MAVQAQLYPEILGLPVSGFQDCWVVSPVSAFEPDFDFCFQDPQHALFPQQNMGIHRSNRGHNASCSSSLTRDSFLSMALSQSLDAQLHMQKQELDSILQLQNERLRCALERQTKQQLAILLNNMEPKAFSLMKQKEEELARATTKTMELEACLRKTEMETESWKRLARANEAMVMDLSKTLEQVRERLVLVNDTTEDAESCFSCHKEQESKEEEESIRMACKNCNSRSSCMLFLPCRHLCSCKNCETFLGSCPVCKSVKEASMEVFWV
ncbi:hypothetical protein SLEP1_g4175 [Rubroshorea leprosula]|uniref:RING-type domain-containing protein n=1 Tax=Rubroshorea leprosula TaxID=152421 RepID=A0AAV5HTL8_9ROSI|nr:hypothetical protein SLEP1_g4175 [Rubroshorea leprosula]